MLALVRPNLVKRLHTGPDLQLGHGKLVGQQGVVTERDHLRCSPGRVKLAGEIWTAAPYDEHARPSRRARPSRSSQIRGATAYVHPVPRA